MKKTIFLISIFFVLGLLTNSCLEQRIIPNGEEPDPTPPPDPPISSVKKFVKVYASIELAPFGLQEFTNETTGLFVYKNADMLMGGPRQTSFANGHSEFEYTEKDSLGYVFGYYPYTSTTTLSSAAGTSYASTAVIGTVYNSYLDSIQDQSVSTNASFSGFPPEMTNRLLMVSTKSDEFSFKGETGNIAFRNVFSLIQFKITKDAALQHFEDQKIKSFQMYPSWGDSTLTPAIPDALSGAIAGTYTVDIKKAAENPTELKPSFSRPLRAITGAVSNSPVVSSNEAIVIWTVVAPFGVYNSKLVFRMETENADGSIKYTSLNTFDIHNNNIERNHLVSYDVVLKKENVYTDDLVNSSSVNYPANTYIISEAGKYAISTKTPTGIVKKGDRVTWLWASKEGGGNQFNIDDLTGDIEYDSQADEIIFRAGSENEVFHKGNVILALLDASDNIVWSWHIWMTDPPQDLIFERLKYTFMDRNLGALTNSASSAVDAYGFVYQWGRKDPFYGANGITADEETSFLIANNNTIRNNTTWNIKSSPGKIDDAVRNPMQFICDNTNLPNDELEDWITNNDNNLWESDGTKTDNDPCPYGYRVPSKEDFDILHTTYEHPSENHYYFRRMGNTHWEYKYPGTPPVTNSWPAAGKRQGVYSLEDGGKIKYSGTAATQGQMLYWTRTPMNEEGISWVGASYRLYSTESNQLYGSHDTGGRADAYSVRCVKMTTGENE
ncbi:MAG: fibrobacter succinogenes major paralogous domain-containing protein [Tannerella sp.]|jgi:uncharacterized protein (TIGR02145 family)|nr:fibrobacter succinogenes major paralogous domain-containing protein [Tannerella sp.]